MTTLDDKVKAKAALADLLELCKNRPEARWRRPFDVVMAFIKAVPTPPPASIYECEGKGGEYELLGPAMSAGGLADMLGERKVDLVIYRDAVSGLVFVRTTGDFQARMRRIR